MQNPEKTVYCGGKVTLAVVSENPLNVDLIINDEVPYDDQEQHELKAIFARLGIEGDLVFEQGYFKGVEVSDGLSDIKLYLN